MMRKDKDYLGIIMDRRRLSEYSLPFLSELYFHCRKDRYFLKEFGMAWNI